MAYDEGQAQRIREHLVGEPGITERRMFGGLAFLGDEAIDEDAALGRWVDVGVAYARSLPPK